MADKKKKSDGSPILDKRVLDRLVERGTLTRGELDSYLKNLPDLAEQADNIADKVYPADGGR